MPSSSRTKTSGQWSTHSPSPVHRSWSIQTRTPYASRGAPEGAPDIPMVTPVMTACRAMLVQRLRGRGGGHDRAEKNPRADVTPGRSEGVLLPMSDLAAISASGAQVDGGVVELVPAFDTFDDALAVLYRDHAKSLVEMLWVFVGDRAEAEDLCQE